VRKYSLLHPTAVRDTLDRFATDGRFGLDFCDNGRRCCRGEEEGIIGYRALLTTSLCWFEHLGRYRWKIAKPSYARIGFLLLSHC